MSAINRTEPQPGANKTRCLPDAAEEHVLEAAWVVVEPRVGGDKSLDSRLIVGVEHLYTAPGSQCDTVWLVRIGHNDLFEAAGQSHMLRDQVNAIRAVVLHRHGGVRAWPDRCSPHRCSCRMPADVHHQYSNVRWSDTCDTRGLPNRTRLKLSQLLACFHPQGKQLFIVHVLR